MNTNTNTNSTPMSLDELESDIRRVALDMIAAQGGIETQKLLLNAVEADLRDRECELRANGQVQGKNEAERDANLHLLTQPERAKLRSAVAASTNAEFAYHKLALRMQMLRDILRIAEIRSTRSVTEDADDHVLSIAERVEITADARTFAGFG